MDENNHGEHHATGIRDEDRRIFESIVELKLTRDDVSSNRMGEETCGMSMEERAGRPWGMELGLVRKKRAMVNSKNFCRLIGRSAVDKDDAMRLISDTSMESFPVMYVNDDLNEEDDLLSIHSGDEDDDSISLVSVVKVKPSSLADYAGYRKGDEFVNVILGRHYLVNFVFFDKPLPDPLPIALPTDFLP